MAQQCDWSEIISIFAPFKECYYPYIFSHTLEPSTIYYTVIKHGQNPMINYKSKALYFFCLSTIHSCYLFAFGAI